MPIQTFTWKPELGAERSKEPDVTPIKFGDGYEVRVSSSINPSPTSWSCTFTASNQDALDIIAFLDARGAKEAFMWTDPLGTFKKYICRKHKSSQTGFGVFSIAATFEQVFEA